MRSEFQFFMSPEDEKSFLDFARKKHGLSIIGKWLVSNDCPEGAIQFLPSEFFDNDLTAGRISFATTDIDGNDIFHNGRAMLEKVYRSLRRQIQTHYSNKLIAYTDGLPSKYLYRNFWLGPSARIWLDTTPEACLRQFKGHSSVFVPGTTSATMLPHTEVQHPKPISVA